MDYLGTFKKNNRDERYAVGSRGKTSVRLYHEQNTRGCGTIYRLLSSLETLPPYVHVLPTAYYVVGKITRYILHNGSNARTGYWLWQLRLIARPTNQQP